MTTTNVFDYSTIEQQVIDYAGEFIEDYDLDGIMDMLRGIDLEAGDYHGPIRSIEDIDIDQILDQFDVSNK